MLLVCATDTAAQPDSIDSAEFARQLETLAERIGTTTPEQIRDVIASIPPSWTVRHDGEPWHVSNAWIVRALEDARRNPQKWEQTRNSLRARLHAAGAEAAAVRTGQATDVASARRIATDVLSRDEFRRNASESAIQRLRERILDWILATWEKLGGNRIGTRRATTVLAWVAALSALAALTWWLLSHVLGPSGRSGLALTAPPARRRNARAWARDAAAAQDPRETVRCAYRAAVICLEEEGAWRTDDTRTPREHLRLLSSSHRRRPVFADVARRFEEVWFGARTATVDDTRTVLSRLEELGCLPGK